MHTALRYAAGGFAEAKGKYRGSIVESFAVVPIGCRSAQDLDDKVRIAGINGSFWVEAMNDCMYVSMDAYSICVGMHTTHVRTALCPPTNRAREPQCKPPAGTIAVFGGTTDCVQRRIDCVGGCRQRHLACADDTTRTSETGVGRWRNHTKAPRQLFHRHPNAALAKRGNKKRTGPGDGKGG